VETKICLFKLTVIRNNHSHWVLASEDPCTVDSSCSNDNPEYDGSHPSAVNRVELDHILFVDLVQKIQITQIHRAKICGIVSTE
jgi:hypothetical protein